MDYTIGIPPPPATAGTRTQTQAELELFGALPVVNELYPVETRLREALRERQPDLADVLALSPAQQQARHRDFATLIRATGLEPLTAGTTLYNLLTDADVDDARGKPVDPAQVKAWDEETRRIGREKWGTDWDRPETGMLARVQKFTRQHPTLAALAQRRGIGSRHEFVLAIAEKVWGLGYR